MKIAAEKVKIFQSANLHFIIDKKLTTTKQVGCILHRFPHCGKERHQQNEKLK